MHETTAGATGSSSTTDTEEPVQCEAPEDCEPVFFVDPQNQLTDIESGWVTCDAGRVLYREEPVDCAHEVFWPKCEGQGGDCANDEDCPGTEVCAAIYGSCSCAAQCMSDSECADGEICLCAGDHPDLPVELYIKNECRPATCTGKADCEGECGCRGNDFCGYTVSAFCPTPADTCSSGADCEPFEVCGFDDFEQRWRCMEAAICE